MLLSWRTLLHLLLLCITVIAPGCASPRSTWYPPLPHNLRPDVQSTPATEQSDIDPRSLPMFTGNGVPASWNDLLRAAAWAEVIFIGEEHDDATGHTVQLAVWQDTLDRWPDASLSMEMFERDDQPVVDDFLDSIIDSAALVRLTHSESWGRDGKWDLWYQPIIDAAKQAGAAIIAANAPRRYVRLARLEGYRRLRAMPPDRRALFDLPSPLLSDAYRQRFLEFMSRGDSDSDHAGEAAFRSQLLWDATMAGSIARARQAGARKVVHLLGQFHSDFEGGTVQQLRRRMPDCRILIISLQRAQGDVFRDEDQQRAHLIIYTGEPPAKTKDEGEDESDVEVEESEATEQESQNAEEADVT